MDIFVIGKLYIRASGRGSERHLPTGYVGLGDKCEALHHDTPQAYPKVKGAARSAPSPAAIIARRSDQGGTSR